MAESWKQFQKRQGPWTASALVGCRGNTPSIEIGGGGEGGRGGDRAQSPQSCEELKQFQI